MHITSVCGNGSNQYRILLTNGGGKSEAARVSDLSKKLEVPISTSQFVQSHTPLQMLSNKYKKILVVGGDYDICRHVAYDYGFQDVVMPVDIIASDHSIWHLHRFRHDDLSLAKPMTDAPIEAILVFNDSRDWGCDTQVIIDILTSEGGKFGTKNSQNKQSIPIYFSNNDLLWSNDYFLPRFGQGAFRACVEKAFEEFTNTELDSVILGKPFEVTYSYAETVLSNWRRDNFGYWDNPKNIYMVGDNPASDIRGANDYGWQSILVKTGVYKEEDDRGLSVVPNFIAIDVLHAVNAAISNEETGNYS